VAFPICHSVPWTALPSDTYVYESKSDIVKVESDIVKVDQPQRWSSLFFQQNSTGGPACRPHHPSLRQPVGDGDSTAKPVGEEVWLAWVDLR
jgi:hypothetical protein